jgi:hypothetical protein
MNGSFLDVLVRHPATEDVDSAKRLSLELNALCERLAASLSALDRPAREELLNRVLQRVWGALDRIDSEAAELFTERQQLAPKQKPAVAGTRDIRENGGVPLSRPNYDMLNALARVAQIQQGMNPAPDDHSLEHLREARSGGMYDADPDE